METPNKMCGGTADEPLKLIEFVRTDASNGKTRIEVKHDNLDRLLQPCGDRPLSIITICGPSRTGKSFLLGYIIRYLEALEQGKTDWMGREEQTEALKGFRFRSGRKPETQGIWAWGRPFVVKTEEGREVAVILVDTQGTQDEFTTTKDMSATVGLSLLTSSVMIYNFSTNLQEDVLVTLNTYVQYGLLALEQSDEGKAPFQKLIFMIRDWNIPDDYAFGGEGGRAFLDEKLEVTDALSKEAKDLRETIRRCFQEIDCFLMPHIGNKGIKRGFKGSISELDNSFACKLQEFISGLMDAENIITKQILGNEITATEFKSYLQMFVETFNSEETPSPTNMLEATTKVHNTLQLQRTLKAYEDGMKKTLNAANYLSEEELLSAHETAEKAGNEEFKKIKKIGDSKAIEVYLQEVNEKMTEGFEQWRKQNADKRDSYISAVSTLTQTNYLNQLETKFPLTGDHDRDFYDERDINEADKRVRAQVVAEFLDKLRKEDEGSLQNLQQHLIQQLRDAYDKLLEKNESHHLSADRDLNKLVKDLVEQYKTRLENQFATHKFLDFKIHDAFHNELKNELCIAFQKAPKPGGKAFHDAFLDDLANLVDEIYIARGDKLKLELKEIQEKAERFLDEECKYHLGNLNPSNIEDQEDIDEDKIKDTLKKEKDKFLKTFDLSKFFPVESIYYKNFMVKVEAELEKVHEIVVKEFEVIFEKKRIEEYLKIKELLIECRQHYVAEMEKQCGSPSFIHPDRLRGFHGTTMLLFLNKFKAYQGGLTKNQKKDLIEEMKILYEAFKVMNDMKLNSEKELGVVPAIGIDLGTTACCVAVYYQGKVIVIPNVDQGGNLTTSSYVAFNSGGNDVVIGEPAKENAYKNAENTIFDAKRIIGRKMDDPDLQKDMKMWPFTVQEDQGVPKIVANGKLLHPEQVSAKLLASFKVMTEKFLQLEPGTIKNAVITVPAYFNDGQRQATVDAGKLAGLEVLTVLNEPTAAAIAYSLERLDASAKKVLVYDFGGGTFDVAVLSMKPKEIEVLGVDGDTHLGGEDFDQNLMNYCAQQFKAKHGFDLFEGKSSLDKARRDEARRRMRRLQHYCEKAKKQLSTARSAKVSIDAIANGFDLEVNVTRDKFEELNDKEFRRTIEIVERALKDANVGKEEIDDIVLVGGSSRILKIQEMLKKFFKGKALNHSINPDQCVAYGAAVRAAMMNGEQSKGAIDLSKVQDVTPLSMGVASSDGTFDIIIPKNTKFPCSLSQERVTVYDKQTIMRFCMYQGENPVAEDNEFLGDFRLAGVPPGRPGQYPATLTMEINAMGIIHVSAVCKHSGTTSSLTINEDKHRLSEEAIKKILAEEDEL